MIQTHIYFFAFILRRPYICTTREALTTMLPFTIPSRLESPKEKSHARKMWFTTGHNNTIHITQEHPLNNPTILSHDPTIICSTYRTTSNTPTSPSLSLHPSLTPQIENTHQQPSSPAPSSQTQKSHPAHTAHPHISPAPPTPRPDPPTYTLPCSPRP